MTKTGKNGQRVVRLGLVGLRFGAAVAEMIVREKGRFLLEAVCDFDAGLAEREGKRLGARILPDLDAMLSDSSIEAIVLITPPAGRAALLRRCLAAGKPVMTTKPFELDATEAEAVLMEAEALGVPIHINSPAPLPAPDLAQISRWREEFDLGIPIGARADVWAGYGRTEPDGSWYDDPHRCPVAPIFRLGIYLINDLVDIFGSARSVFAMSSRLLTGRPTPDTAQLSIHFANGALANVFSSFCVHDGDDYSNALTLNFERGTIYRNAGPSRDSNAAELSLVMKPEGVRKVVASASCGLSGAYQWEAFHRAVCEDPLPRTVPPRQVGDAIRIIRAMASSEQSGQKEFVQ